MSGIEVFQRDDWTVRTLLVDGDPYFVLADVCEALSITNARDVVSSLDLDEKGVGTVDTPGGPQRMTTVTEAGLYSVILRSRKPEARSFKRWLTHEVIPSIRRTGVYGQPALPQGDMLAHLELAVAGWRSEREGREIAEAKVAELAPAAGAWQALAADGTDWDVRTVAQLLSRDPAITIGQNRLMAHLRDVKWIDQWNNPYQAQVDNGRLARKHGAWTDDDGGKHPTVSTRVTVKGIEALHKQLGGAQPVAFPLAVVS